MERVEDVKRPLKKGEFFIVPCIIKEMPTPTDTPELLIIPVINQPHSDRENGQKEVHYHIDMRFFDIHNKYFEGRDGLGYNYIPRPIDGMDGKFERFVLPVINEEFGVLTPVDLIANSKLKHKCIHKGKCPHRGMDLSQVKAVDGIITCPLHSLKFSEKTGKLLTEIKFD